MRNKFQIHVSLKGGSIKTLEKFMKNGFPVEDAKLPRQSDKHGNLYNRSEIIDKALELLNDTENNIAGASKRTSKPISTGSEALNKILDDGVHSGFSVLVKGRSGCGKTPVILKMMDNAMSQTKDGYRENCVLVSPLTPKNLGLLDRKHGLNLEEHYNKKRLKIFNYYDSEELTEYLLSNHPLIVAFDDLKSLLYKKGSEETIIFSEGWIILKKIIGTISAVVIMTSIDVSDSESSTFDIVLEMKKQQRFSFIEVEASTAPYPENLKVRLISSAGKISFKLEPKEHFSANQNVDLSVIDQQENKSIEDTKPIEFEIMKILDSTEHDLTVSYVKRQLWDVGYLANATIRRSFQLLMDNGIIEIYTENDKIKYIRNNHINNLNELLKKIVIDKMSGKSKAKAFMVSSLIKKSDCKYEYLISITSKKFNKSRKEVVTIIRSMKIRQDLVIREKRGEKYITLTESFIREYGLDQ